MYGMIRVKLVKIKSKHTNVQHKKQHELTNSNFACGHSRDIRHRYRYKNEWMNEWITNNQILVRHYISSFKSWFDVIAWSNQSEGKKIRSGTSCSIWPQNSEKWLSLTASVLILWSSRKLLSWQTRIRRKLSSNSFIYLSFHFIMSVFSSVAVTKTCCTRQ